MSGNLAMFRKSVSKVSIGKRSFFERAYSTSSGLPLGSHTMLWPCASATRVSGRDIFSSTKNFTDGRKIDNSVAPSSRGGKLQCRLNMLFGYRGPRIQDGLISLAVSKCVQDLPDHDSGAVKRELASAYLRICDNVFIDDGTLHTPSSITHSGMTQQTKQRCRTSEPAPKPAPESEAEETP